jgi:geranylgeranyl diphosphate synthase, type I
MKDKQQSTGELIGRFAGWKQDIVAVLASAVKTRREEYKTVHPLGPDALDRILDFSSGGKMLRGGLVCLANGLVDGSVNADAYVAGAALELFQSALLIHDDIMDRDLTRRGAPSVFNQYQDMAESSYVDDFFHLGEALGICAGDVAFFLGFELLTEMESPSGAVNSLLALCGRELGYVGVAQMADVLRGSTAGEVSVDTPLGHMLETADPENAVLDLYRYKTGRYTFSLPLMIGATLAGGDDGTVSKLEQLGEELGILFQLKDDEIGIYGDEAETGKPIGSDIREGKKTLFYVYLLDSAEGAERERLASLYGGPDIGAQAIQGLLQEIESRGVRARVTNKANQLADKARRIIGDLTAVDPSYVSLLEELVDYNLSRTR